MTARILLLEDDPATAGTVAFALQREGLAVEHVRLTGAARASVAAPLRAELRAVRPDLEPIATHRGMGDSRELPR